MVVFLTSCAGNEEADIELARVSSGSVDVVLLSADDALSVGRDALTLAFLAASDGSLLNVGTVRVNPSMPMPRMMMFGDPEIQPAGVRGRYTVDTDLDMAGPWRLSVEWDGPAGSGEVTLRIAVR